MRAIEKDIAEWRDGLVRRGLLPAEREELEDHLLSQVEELEQDGLSGREALVIALGRIGDTGGLSASFSRVHAGRIWKQMSRESRGTEVRSMATVLLLFGLQLLLSQLPRAVSLPFSPENPAASAVYTFLLIYLILAAYFIRKREVPWKPAFVLLVLPSLIALAAGIYALRGGGGLEDSATVILVVIHLPLLLWLYLLPLYTGTDEWRSPRRVLDFIRFTGEAFIYAVLIGCGLIVSTGAALALFGMIGIDIEEELIEFLITGIIPLIPLAAALLVEAKGHLLENFAPVLARIFLPLFLVIMGGFLITSWVTGNPVGEERELLLIVDLLLVFVLAMILYSASIDRRESGRGGWDVLIAVSAAAAVIIDIDALRAVALRFTAYGISPNRIAVLGENILLLANLSMLLVLFILLLAGRIGRTVIFRFQAIFLGLYALWFLVPVLLLPPLFAFQ